MLCLGFDFAKKKTSRYFIITFLLVKNPNPVEKIISKTFLSLPSKKRKTHCGILHCYKEDNKTRTRLFSLLKGQDVAIMVILLDKKRVFSKLQDEKIILYNYITNILLDVSVRQPSAVKGLQIVDFGPNCQKS